MQSNAAISRRSAWLLLILVIVLWGANWPVMKFGLAYIPPLSFATLRMLMGALVLFLVAAWRGQLGWPARGDWPVVLGVGLLQMAGFLGLVTLALRYVPAGRSSILAYTTALWVAPLAVLLLHERLRALQIAGLVLGLAGVAVLFNPLALDWGDAETLLGNALLLLAALLWALLIVQVRGHRWRGSPLSLGPWQFLIATGVLLPIALAVEDTTQIHWGSTLGWVLLYNGPVATAFCFWAMLTVTRALPAVTTSLGTLGVPVVGYLSSALFLGEDVTLSNLGGLALILAGLACVSYADRSTRTAAPTVPAEPR